MLSVMAPYIFGASPIKAIFEKIYSPVGKLDRFQTEEHIF
jgi:hypothetical protein